MKHYVLFLFFILQVSVAKSETIVHTVHWEKGVNNRTVNGWIKSLDRVSDVSSTTYIKKKAGGKDKLHRKGHRDVIVWVPATTDLTKNFAVVLWFHGHYGYVPHRTFEDRTLKQFVPLTRTKNFAVVIPEMPWSVHTKTPTKRNSLLWKKPGDFINFVNQVKSVLLNHANPGIKDATETKEKLGEIDYRIVGHSAGGSTIKRLGITGDLCKLEPSLVVWSDSSYGSWLDNAWDGCLEKNRGILVKVFVQKWLAPWKSATRFLGQFQDPPENFEFHVKNRGWSHKLIGNNIVKLAELLGQN